MVVRLAIQSTDEAAEPAASVARRSAVCWFCANTITGFAGMVDSARVKAHIRRKVAPPRRGYPPGSHG